MEKSKANWGIGTAGSSASISAALIGILQLKIFNLTQDEIHLYTTIIPFFITGIVTLIDWFFAKLKVKPAAVIRTEQVIEDHIDFLDKKIEDGKNKGRDTTELEIEHNKIVIARSKTFSTLR
ncbi:hypothetical protein [Shewanella sp. ENK2]|uniref:hypothetical protein n=1 Tax=Shewanella sp. ENK2 TaxID=2775245 RepID=UPI00374901DA